jgi:hypothetical protein
MTGYPTRRQLYRKRHPLQPPAHLRDTQRIASLKEKRCVTGGRSFDEQFDRRESQKLLT